MTKNQKIVLAHFDRINAGAIYHDRRREWVWKRDVRSDAALADEIVADRAADLRREIAAA